MFYVYLLQSINFPQQSYVGITDNLRKRFKAHNNGGSIYTNKYKPWKIVVYLGFDKEDKARKFEKYLKSHAGRLFIKKYLW